MSSSDSETVHGGRADGELLPQQVLGPYQIQRKIGSGGMGVVYLAMDLRLKRQVALKILPPDKALNPILVKRFRSEAEKVAQLRHENIVSIYDTGDVQGYSYMAMEYIEGTDVQKLLDVRKRIPIRRSLDIVKQVTRALAHANAISIVHRDIKPANLLIKRDGTVKLTDMGLARTMDDSPESGITRAGTTVGTIDYMSPEQARDSKSADTRSDIYSLGCTWYQMLAGEPPYPEGSLTNKLRAHAYGPIPDPRHLNPDVPEPIVAVVQRMMAKNPDDRYQTPDKLLDDLQNPNLLLEGVGQKLFAEIEAETPSNKGAKLPSPEVDDRPVVERGGRSQGAQNHVAKTGPQGKIEKTSRPNPVPGLGTVKSTSQRVLSRHERESEDAQGMTWRLMMGVAFVVVAGIAYLGVTAAWPKVQQYFFPAAGRDQSNPLEGRNAEHVAPRAPVPVAKPPETKTAAAAKPAEKPDPGKTPQTPMTTETPNATPAPVKAAPVAPGQPLLAQMESVPEWINKTLPTTGMRIHSVGPGASSEYRFPTVNAALNALPAEGGIVEIAGEGPFPVRPAEISQKYVVLRGAAGTRPLLQFLPAERDNNNALLTFTNGLFQVQGLDLVVQGAALKETSLTAFLSAHDSDFYLIDSSINLLGGASKTISAVRYQGIPKRESAGAQHGFLLAQRLMIRGENLSGLELGSPHAEVVVRECLVTLSDGDALRIVGKAGTREQALSVRILESTLSSRGNGFHLIAPENGASTPVGISLQNSILSSPASERSALLTAENWPKSLGSDETSGPLLGVYWAVKKSTISGWKSLLKMLPEDTLSTQSPEEWKKLWKQSATDEEIVSGNWPSAPDAFSPLQPVNVWGRETLAQFSKETGQGCNVGVFPSRPPSDWQHLAEYARRPTWEANLPVTGEPVSIDANRADAGRKLTERDWPDGTTFKISGSGLRTSSPLAIKNRKLRLIFEEGGEAPLILSPRSLDFRERSSNADQAFISVENGFVEIIGGKFTVSLSDRQHPDWFLKVDQGSFALKGTQFETPLTRESPLKGWIKWAGSPPPKETQSLISGCTIMGGGVLVDATLNRRSLIVRNSLLVSRDDVFLLQGSGRSGKIEPGCLDIERTTLAAGGAFYRTNWPISGQGKSLFVFADSCLYLPTLVDPQKPLLPVLMANSESNSLPRMSWRETHCGYASELSTYLSGWPVKEATLKTVDEWQKQWGAGSVQSALSKPGDIQFLETAGTKGLRIRPSQYQLKPQAPAASWGVGRLPIGADLKMLATEAPDSGTSDSTPMTPRTPAKSAPVKPQKSPGF
ncbi:MAG: serine/threonine-protein kinase [Planctomycetales bacterium]